MLIVNSFASSVTARNTVVVHRRLSEGARSLTGGSVRRHNVEVVETNRRGHATRFANDAARRGVDVVIGYGGDGTLNEVATGIAGTDTAHSACFQAVQPTCSRARSACRTIPVEAADSGTAGSTPRYSSDRSWAGERAVLLLPHRHRVRRGSGPTGRAARFLETLARPSPFHLRRPLRPGSAATTASIRTSASMATAHHGGRQGRTTAISRSSSTPTRTPTSATARSTSPPPPHSTGDSSSSPSAQCAHAILTSLAGALKGGGVKPRRPPRHPTDVDLLRAEHTTPFPYQVDGDALGETSRLEFVHVP